MHDVETIKDRVLNGDKLSKREALSLTEVDLEPLCKAANQLRESIHGSRFDLCTIISGKNGRCTEDCKFCAQSSYHDTDIEEHALLEEDVILRDARQNQEKGTMRYSIVTSGKRLTKKEVETVCQCYRGIKDNCSVSLCASHGLLTYEQFLRLKSAGVMRYHNNLETSRRYFPNICTTHTYDDKIAAIVSARKAGLEICCGGIFGMGETWEDRVDMALDIRDLEVRSIPINILNPVSGTRFEHLPILSENEVKRIVAIYRFIHPHADIRLAGGRNLLNDKGRSVFLSGANAAITGNMLTTAGIGIEEDIKMFQELYLPQFDKIQNA